MPCTHPTPCPEAQQCTVLPMSWFLPFQQQSLELQDDDRHMKDQKYSKLPDKIYSTFKTQTCALFVLSGSVWCCGVWRTRDTGHISWNTPAMEGQDTDCTRYTISFISRCAHCKNISFIKIEWTVPETLPG